MENSQLPVVSDVMVRN